MYAATKSFDTFIAEGLNHEFAGKIDVISYRPASVDSLMNPKKKGASGFINSAQAAQTCLEGLGRQAMTHGWWHHELIGHFINSVSTSYSNNNFY